MLKIQKDVPLAPLTTLKVGGPAQYFVEVEDEKELKEALQKARENNWQTFILAGGSNVLISDQGFKGLVIKLIGQKLVILQEKKREVILQVDAGVNLGKLLQMSSEKGWSGLEWAVGIPGTIGGAVYNNAGAFGGEIANLVVGVKAWRKHNSYLGNWKMFSDIINFSQRQCKFKYRTSLFKEEKKWIILNVELRMLLSDKEKIDHLMKEYSQKRQKNQPFQPSAGSFFKNPLVKNKKLLEQFEKDFGTKARDSKIPAGWLIEKLGIKGKQIGGAQISEKHANFLINTGNAKAEDFIILASIIKQKVRNHFGIQLKEEIEMIGF